MEIWIVSTKVRGDHYQPGEQYEWQHFVHNNEAKARKAYEKLRKMESIETVLNVAFISLPEASEIIQPQQ